MSQVVEKTRHLYLAGQTRLHLDEVVGLGTFIELEVVLREGQSQEEGRAIARQWMQALEMREEDLIQGAYADLLPGLWVVALPSIMSALANARQFQTHVTSFARLAVNGLRHSNAYIMPGIIFGVYSKA